MSFQLLQGVRVIDLAGEPLSMAGRMLADMGAEVVKLETVEGDPLRRVPPLDRVGGTSLRFLAWNAGKSSIAYDDDDPRVKKLLRSAHIILQTPGFGNALQLNPSQAPQAVWLNATPFGLQGPRAKWRASDLGIVASSGNMYATGYRDTPPLRCSEPTTYAHASAEAVFAVLTALASGRPQVIDLSMQEAVLIANMSGAGQFPKTGHRGQRQGADLGGTREIWPCRDGYVSFGLRGGPARVPNFKILHEQLARENLLTDTWAKQDWKTFNPRALNSEELRAIESPLAAYFARHTMTELYQLAVETRLMLAPANSAGEIFGSEQLAARNMFLPVGEIEQFPARFFLARDLNSTEAPVTPPRRAPELQEGPWPEWHQQSDGFELQAQNPDLDRGAWEGLKLVEFGAGAAGPIACRYFIEQGATVIRIESSTHPDFLRVMSASSPQGLEGSTLFDALNVGKQSITLNLKHPEGKEIARQLMFWADAVLENFAPRAMKSYGLDYAQVAQDKPDLIMLSTCLNGQSGPHKDYPGFGGQGAALSGFNYLTGWPDREPIGPFGTITDSLAPRFAASALAAALLHRQRSGRGVHLDLSQVETGVYSLSPWLLEYSVIGQSRSRDANRSSRAAPHGVFPCRGEDRWIAIACWTDEEWVHLATIFGLDPHPYADIESRLAGQGALETLLSDITRNREAHELAKQLQYAGIEAVPVADFEDLLRSDPQLQFRDHFVPLERALTGESLYERNGFRLSAAPSGFERPAPLLGEHTEDILTTILGYSADQIGQLRELGAID